MSDPNPKRYRLLIIISLLLLAGLALGLCGAGLPATLLIVSTLALFFYCFSRKQPEKDEQPCSLVSCCHYLGDEQDEKINEQTLQHVPSDTI